MQFDPDGLQSRTVGPHIKSRKMIRPASIVTTAAAIAILLGIGTLILSPDSNQSATYVNNVTPDTDNAILTLLNETKIKLSDPRSSSLLYHLGNGISIKFCL